MLGGKVRAGGCLFSSSIQDVAHGRLNMGRGRVLLKRVKGFVRRGGRAFLVSVFSRIREAGPRFGLLLVDSKVLVPAVGSGIRSLRLSSTIIFLKGAVGIRGCLDTVSLFLLPSLRRKLPLMLIRTRTSKLAYIISSAITERTSLARAD